MEAVNDADCPQTIIMWADIFNEHSHFACTKSVEVKCMERHFVMRAYGLV